MFLVHVQVYYLDTPMISVEECVPTTHWEKKQKETRREEKRWQKCHKYANAYRRVRLELHQTAKPRSAELDVNPNRRGQPSLVVSCRSAHRLQHSDCRLSPCFIRILRWHFSEHDGAWNWSHAAWGFCVCRLTRTMFLPAETLFDKIKLWSRTHV